jgi:hypothetical protein
MLDPTINNISRLDLTLCRELETQQSFVKQKRQLITWTSMLDSRKTYGWNDS